MARVSSEVRELAREISAVKRGLRDATVTPQLGRSSLDDESINTYDSDGNLRARYGLQHDGTYTAAVLDGPVPPVPSVPVVSGGPGEFSVTWDGTYVDDERAPMDFHVVEVWAADTDFSDRSEARLLGHFANESGGDITVARPVGSWHVALVAQAQSGRRSAVSGRAVAVVESVVDQGVIDDLNEKLDGLPSVTWSEDAPTSADGDDKSDNAVWRQVDASTDAVIGEWTWDETNGVWVARPIADDAIYSLDVGKLFASQLGVDTAVANEIWAEKIAASKIDAEEINTQSLGADTGFIGVLNSAEIVGAVIKTAASGARVELDSGNGIRIFNTAGDLVLSADSDGNLITGANQDTSVKLSPKGITLNTSQPIQVNRWGTPFGRIATIEGGGVIYAAAYSGKAVNIFTSDGQKVGGFATENESLAIAVNADEYIYVGDTPNRLVDVYDINGSRYGTWHFNDYVYSIASVTHDKTFVGTAGNVIYSVTNAGHKQFSFNTDGLPLDSYIYGDELYVVTSSQKVQVFDIDGGNLKRSWPTKSLSGCIAVNSNMVFVTRSLEKTVDVFSLTGTDIMNFETEFHTHGLTAVNDYIAMQTGNGGSVDLFSLPGAEHVTASLEADNGTLKTLAADMGGVTQTEVLSPRSVTPRDRTDNEDYAPTVEIVRPAFTQGMHVFEDTTHRDLELPDPPDGTQAWTGTGETLTQWTRLNGAWEAIHTGPHYLRIGDDGAPRLWADPELVYDREYAAAPNLHIPPFGTIGRSTLPPPVSARGTISIPVSGSAGATATVTFPTGLFSGAPTTFVSRASAGAAKYVAYTVNISASSMTVGVYAGDGTAGSHTAVVSWRAEQ